MTPSPTSLTPCVLARPRTSKGRTRFQWHVSGSPPGSRTVTQLSMSVLRPGVVPCPQGTADSGPVRVPKGRIPSSDWCDDRRGWGGDSTYPQSPRRRMRSDTDFKEGSWGPVSEKGVDVRDQVGGGGSPSGRPSRLGVGGRGKETWYLPSAPPRRVWTGP